MNYFRLDNDCFLVEGARDAALYDVTGQRLYVLDEPAHRILRQCEANVPLDYGLLGDRGKAMLEFLREEGLGFFDERPSFVEKFSTHGRLMRLDPPETTPYYRIADWSITQACDVGCSFCPLETNGTSWHSCTTCLRKAVPENYEWTRCIPRVVDQIADLGITRLHIRGGNPLLTWDLLVSILRAAERHPKLTVIVTTPGTGRPITDLLNLFGRPNVGLNLVLFATDQATAKRTCGDEVLRRQCELLDALSQHKMRFRVSLLLSKSTFGEGNLMAASVRERWRLTPRVAEVYSAVEAMNGVSFSRLAIRRRVLHGWRTPEELYGRALTSVCLTGRFQINADGSIHPCAALDQYCGCIVDGDLGAALRDETLYHLWKSNKNDIKPCSECAFRHLCIDCAAAEVNSKLQISNVPQLCAFDPQGPLRAYQVQWDHIKFAKVAILGPTVEGLCQTLPPNAREVQRCWSPDAPRRS